MAKSNTKTDKAGAQTNASYSRKDNDGYTPAKDNPSKYAPTDDTEMDMLSLDPADGLMKLFVDSIKDIYWAENHLVKALPKMANGASLKSLKKAILDHQEDTMTHVARLIQIFELLGKDPQAKNVFGTEKNRGRSLHDRIDHYMRCPVLTV